MKKDYLVHYFKDDQKELINRKEISFRFLSIDYTFITADNVFSKDHVDSGSELLLTSALSEGLENDVLDYGCGYGVIGIV
ncbi:MAG TPA: methyltransferase, partial [Erysipelotrichaceae bacterium]|nr:methyltransferase [Erysipelotrichaceae bacterium]